MQVDGRCHCGAISFRATVNPQQVAICHCSDCQVLTGTAYRVSVPAPREHFTLLRGTPAVYVKAGESGARRAQAFCPDCASHLYAYGADEAQPKTYGLRVGCLDQRRELAPQRQKWCSSAMPWSADIGGLPRAERE